MEEFKFSILSLSSAQLKHQLPAATLTPDTQCTEPKDDSPLSKQSMPYTEARAMLDALQHQMSLLVVIKNGLLQTTPYPGVGESQNVQFKVC